MPSIAIAAEAMRWLSSLLQLGNRRFGVRHLAGGAGRWVSTAWPARARHAFSGAVYLSVITHGPRRISARREVRTVTSVRAAASLYVTVTVVVP